MNDDLALPLLPDLEDLTVTAGLVALDVPELEPIVDELPQLDFDVPTPLPEPAAEAQDGIKTELLEIVGPQPPPVCPLCEGAHTGYCPMEPDELPADATPTKYGTDVYGTGIAWGECAPAVHVPPTPTIVFDTYLRFAVERMAMYWRRVNDMPIVRDAITFSNGDQLEHLTWTRDPILQEYRFTNVYRATDRVSQFLIKEVIYGEPDAKPADLIFRILLFKVFNRIDTWVEIVTKLGRYPVRWHVAAIRKILEARAGRMEPIYSAAYMMPPPGGAKLKYAAHLDIIKSLADNHASLLATKSLAELFGKLRDVAGFGPFLAMQYAIDLNYSPLFDFDENDFIVAGPGAVSGIDKCFSRFGTVGGHNAIIEWTRDHAQQKFSERGFPFAALVPANAIGEIGTPRWPTLIDWQNVYCEVDKYARIAHPEIAASSGRTKIKQRYKPDETPLPAPFLPPKWRRG